MALLVAANYFLFFHGGDDYQVPSVDEQLRSSDAERIMAESAEAGVRGGDPVLDDFGEPTGRVVEGKLNRGQTVLRALRDVGIDQQSALPLIHAMDDVFDFRKAQVGDTFTASLNDEGQVTHLSYVQSPLEVYDVELLDDGSYEARKKKVPTRIDIAYVGCAIRSSLYESLTRCGESPQLAGRIIDLFAWDVDFFQDVREGDVLRVIVEKVSVDGRFLKYGDIMAAEFAGKFGKSQIVGFRDPAGGDYGHYTPEGRSVRKDFLKSPLKYTRVSAKGNSGVRRSLKKASPVVYTARAKTPVWAVSAGTVVFAGHSGALGRTVTIKHDNGYTSTYGHLGKISRGIRGGARVSQKTILGAVGKSGSATEPQLLYSLRKSGRLIDPLKMRYTEGEPVATEHRPDFDREVKQLLEDLRATPIIGVLERRG